MSLVFFDTEFTNFEDMDLISVGLSSPGREGLHIVLADGWKKRSCSSFVHTVVIPLLVHRNPEKLLRAEAAARIRDWLCCDLDEVTFVCDYDGDAFLLARLMKDGGKVASIAHAKALFSTPDKYSDFMDAMESELSLLDDRHNALADASCLQKVLLDMGMGN